MKGLRAKSSWHRARMKAVEAVKTKNFQRREDKARYGGQERARLAMPPKSTRNLLQLASSAANVGPPNIRGVKAMRWYRRTILGRAPTVRDGCTAAVLGDHLYVFGGMGGSGGDGDAGRTSAMYRCPLKEYGVWEPVSDAKGTPPPPRSGHTATVVNGEMWIYGGEGAYNGLNQRITYGDLLAYNPRKNTWRNLDLIGGPPYNLLPPARRGHTATVLKTPMRHKVIVFGGRGLDRVFGQDVYFNDLQVMDVPSMMWVEMQAAGPTPPARSMHTATLLPATEQLFIIGGLSADIVATRRCPRSASHTSRRGFVLGAGLPQDPDAVIGGEGRAPPSPKRSPQAPSAADEGTSIFASADVYILNTHVWSWTKVRPAGEGPGQVYGHGACAHPDPTMHHIFVTGGRKPQRSQSMKSSLFLLDTDTLTWSSPTLPGPCPSGRYGHAMVPGHECLIVFGGSSFNEYCNEDLYQLLMPMTVAAKAKAPPRPKPRVVHVASPSPVRGQLVTRRLSKAALQGQGQGSPTKPWGYHKPSDAAKAHAARARAASTIAGSVRSGVRGMKVRTRPASAVPRSGRGRVAGATSRGAAGMGQRRASMSALQQQQRRRRRPGSALPRSSSSPSSAAALRRSATAQGRLGIETRQPGFGAPPAPGPPRGWRDMQNYVEPLDQQGISLRTMMHAALGLPGPETEEGDGEEASKGGSQRQRPASAAAGGRPATGRVVHLANDVESRKAATALMTSRFGGHGLLLPGGTGEGGGRVQDATLRAAGVSTSVVPRGGAGLGSTSGSGQQRRMMVSTGSLGQGSMDASMLPGVDDEDAEESDAGEEGPPRAPGGALPNVIGLSSTMVRPRALQAALETEARHHPRQYERRMQKHQEKKQRKQARLSATMPAHLLASAPKRKSTYERALQKAWASQSMHLTRPAAVPPLAASATSSQIE